jgi:hypothetical protein
MEPEAQIPCVIFDKRGNTVLGMKCSPPKRSSIRSNCTTLARSPKISSSGGDRGPKVIQETEINKGTGSKTVVAMVSTRMRMCHGNDITDERNNSRNRDIDSFLYRIRNYSCAYLLCDGIGGQNPENRTYDAWRDNSASGNFSAYFSGYVRIHRL